MRRRDFIITLIGGGLAAGPLAWPLMAEAPAQTVPVIGFLGSAARDQWGALLAAFRQGLADVGYIEGRNVAIEYRWADNHYDKLPSLAADLVRRNVTVLVASGGTLSAKAAQAETATIPILFVSGFDPNQLATVAGLRRGEGNATGVSLYTTNLTAKRLELLRELVPGTSKIALLVNPAGPMAEVEMRDVGAAAHEAGLQLLVLKASTTSEIEEAFVSASQQGINALLVGADVFLSRQREQLVALAARHAVRAVYPWREYVETGGLMSYGPRLSDAYREIGRYTGRILKGAAPADLPLQAPRKFELIINLKTASTLGLTVPPLLLARADEVIE
jgi:putative tryptophan/tyrosine transport system substrate-binding protein